MLNRVWPEPRHIELQCSQHALLIYQRYRVRIQPPLNMPEPRRIELQCLQPKSPVCQQYRVHHEPRLTGTAS
jgi:hypothetical protein